MKSPQGSRARRSNTPVQYVIGVDFGTLSARAVLVSIADGAEVATAVANYGDGVIEAHLPGSAKRLPPDTALQNPADYLTALTRIIPQVLKLAKAKPEQVVGLGTDFTCCTVLPTRTDGTPLCEHPRWRKNPHTWVKLWKHHSPQPEADRINALGTQCDEGFIRTYGGKYSSEWFFSKLLETVTDAPPVYDAADCFIEGGDWIVWQLTGVPTRNLSAAGFKGMRVYPDGQGGWTYPAKEFFKALHPKLENVVAEKLPGKIVALGDCVGGLTPAMAKRLGLPVGLPIAAGNIDAHVAVPASTVTTPGRMVMIMGTSTCHLLLSDERHEVEGMCGVVEHGVVPGLWGYEAGQAGVGDLFAWYVEHAVPAYVQAEAKQRKLDVYQYLEAEAAKVQPGESGLLALDWWNGNRSVLVDADLTGLIVGLSIGSRPPEIYRALLEATAFGTRKIIEAFTNKGVRIDELVACGGLAVKNPLLMQIYADVTGRPIRIAASDQACALGAAMQGAVAAGVYPDIHAAAKRMARLRREQYRPRKQYKAVYDQLYAEYTRLHDAFGRDAGSTMKVLKGLRRALIG